MDIFLNISQLLMSQRNRSSIQDLKEWHLRGRMLKTLLKSPNCHIEKVDMGGLTSQNHFSLQLPFRDSFLLSSGMIENKIPSMPLYILINLFEGPLASFYSLLEDVPQEM